MNSFVAGIDPGEKESYAKYMAPDGDIREQFSFPMTLDGYRTFRENVPEQTGIVFEASGSAYSVSGGTKKYGIQRHYSGASRRDCLHNRIKEEE